MKNALLLAILLAAAAHAATPTELPPGTKADDLVPDPEIERQSLQVADGFEVTLFAADPKIAKPIAMNFDTAGRLWVVSSSMYPQIKPGEIAHDKLIILEDKDGDGKAEAGRIFADGLMIPTGIELGDGGAYVANSTELLYLKDTDGDGVADTRKIVLSGSGTEDTHHILHTLRWGPDGVLNMNQSIYIHSFIETPYGPRKLTGSGTWRFRPRTMELEVFSRGLVNPWGHAWDKWGQAFATDGAGFEGPAIYYPGAAYGSWGTDAKRWLTGLNPGSPKYCGAEIIYSTHFPSDWQGDLITADFRANRIVRFKIEEEGSGYVTKLQSDVIKSTDKSFRPVDIKLGPDGALYIADWYNPVINHGEVDFRDPRRDHTHGRIWRVSSKSHALLPRPAIAGAPIPQLLDNLKSPEIRTRHFSRREVYERDPKEVATALSTWLSKLDPNDPEVEHYRLEALWTYSTINLPNLDLLKSLLAAKDPHARAAASHQLIYWHDRLLQTSKSQPQTSNDSDTLAQVLLEPMTHDSNPKVRLEAILALGRIPNAKSIELAAQALDLPTDRYIDYAFYLTALRLSDIFLPAFTAGQITFGGNLRHMAAALSSLDSPEALAPLMSMLKQNKIRPDQMDDLLATLSNYGASGDLAALFDYALASRDDKLLSKTLTTLLTAAKTRRITPTMEMSRLVPLLSHKDESTLTTAIRLVGLYKLQSQRDALIQIAQSKTDALRPRQAAIESIALIDGRSSTKILAPLSSSTEPLPIRITAITSMIPFDLKTAASKGAELLTSDTANLDLSALLGPFIQRQDGAQALTDALSGKKIPIDTAKLALRYLYGNGLPAGSLIDMFRSAASVTAVPTELSPDQMKQLVAEIQQKGDANRGESIFRSKTTSCYTCHALAGAGGQLGPDLSAVGSASPIEYLIDSILLPSKNVKEGFDAIAVTTKSGDFYSGIRVLQSERELVLRDAVNDAIHIPLSDIKNRKNAGSLMPTGLADLLTHQEFVDLVKFLSVLGTPGHQPTPAAIVRRWRILESADIPTTPPADLDALPWFPLYSTFAGDLPSADLPNTLNLLRFDVEVTTPGPVILNCSAPAAIQLLTPQNITRLDSQTTLNLSPGAHSFLLICDRSKAPSIRITLQEPPGAATHFRITTGK